ncbi:MbtH family protein [Streptomyces sp. NBC_01387]|uniref:MbtH family protein n=1 Tax=unclassified Streptomyces TaxID=2593676 RepID=UPI002DD9EF53|nr:MbtH family protein [Streptomyces sp. NBC_01766]WSC25018.1 MbtH family protein [Streptomyces sp. NBC_01766]
MDNPFDDTTAEFFVLMNEEGQYSLWPATIAIPDGWSVEHGKAARQECVEHIDTHWVDMRPRTLVEATQGS